MRRLAFCSFVIVSTLAASSQQTVPANPTAPRGPMRILPIAVDPQDHEGFTKIFDGTSMRGWDANPAVWSVKDGALAGEYKSAEGTRNAQTFAIYRGSEPADFDLKLEVKLEGETADSGIQYHSASASPATPRPGMPPPMQDLKWDLVGLQFDLSLAAKGGNVGIVAEGGGRGIIGSRGQIIHTQTGKTPQLLGALESTENLEGFFKPHDWNSVYLIVRGRTVIQMINGHVTGILLDEDAAKWKANGLLGLQCAGPGSVKISFRNIWLKEIKD